jgi:5-methylcytosine-specific restriction endonuclease McrA
MKEKQPLQSIPDDELLRRLAELTGQSRRVEVDIVAHIAEVEERKLYAREAFPSMFAYCRDALHLSEQEAYLRIAVARASRKHPMLLAMLGDGRLHLTAIGKLAPHLTRENRDGLLERATHKTKRQLEELIAEIAPRPDVPTAVRKLPERRTVPTSGNLVLPSRGEDSMLEFGPDPALERLGPGRVGVLELASTPLVSAPVAASRVSPSVQPLSPGRYKVQFTVSAEFCHKLERLRALAGVPEGDLAAVIEQAVTEKLERIEARRFAKKRAPDKGAAKTTASPLSRDIPARTEPCRERSPSSRHISAAVRRAVYERDGGRCRYVDEEGRRCPERHLLEFHHEHPFGLGGGHSVANIRLMCPAHNAYLAECDYGRKTMARHRRPGGQASPSPAG